MAAIFGDLLPQNRTNCVDVNIIAKNVYHDVTNHDFVQIIFGTIYSLIFLLGFTGNGGVILAVARVKKLQSARNFFLMNLMLADVLLCIVAIPVTPFAIITKEWVFGPVLCRALPLSQSVSVIVTSWSLTAISLDKFVHIIDPTKPKVTLKKGGVLTVIIWTLATLINIPYVLSYVMVDGGSFVNQSDPTAMPFCGQFCEEVNWQSEIHKRTYGTAIMLVQFVVPMVIITYCYSRILTIVRRDMIVDNRHFSHSLTARQKLEAIKRKRKVNYILIGMVVAFVAAWLPLTLVNIQRDFGTLPMFISSQPYLWALVVHSIAMTTVIWNPVLFFWLTHKRKTPKAARSMMETTAAMFGSLYRGMGSHSPSFINKTITSWSPKGSCTNGMTAVETMTEIPGNHKFVIRKRKPGSKDSCMSPTSLTSPTSPSETEPLNPNPKNQSASEVLVHSGSGQVTNDNSLHSMASAASYYV